MSAILMSSAELKQQFVSTFNSNRVTLVISGTGTGKTVTVPMLIHNTTGKRVICSEPRIPNVTGACEGTMAVHNFNNVGYKYATASQNQSASVLFVTDGMVAANPKMIQDILVIDEVHEFNSNMELLLNYARLQLIENPNFKLVLMSATVDSKVERIRSYFADYSIGQCNFEGRGFPIAFEQSPKRNIFDSIYFHLANGLDTMVFVAGKGEGEELHRRLELEKMKHYEVLHLSGESDADTRRKITTKGSKPRLWIATNVAQAGITPANLGVVIMTGLKKIITCESGYEGLRTVDISQEDMTQQMGRCGRMFAGIAEWHGDVRVEDLEAETAAEILRIDLAGFCLSLLTKGIDPLVAKFVNQPNIDSIKEALKTLKELGAINSINMVTSLGREMSQISLSPRLAKAVIVAKKHGVTASMVKLMSVVENNMIFRKGHDIPTTNSKSVAISTLNAYNSIKTMSSADFKEKVNQKAVGRIAELNQLVFRSLGNVGEDTGNEEALRKAIAESAASQVFKKYSTNRWGQTTYQNIFSGEYVTASGISEEFVTGKVRGNNGKLFLDCATAIEKEWLTEIYADKIETFTGSYSYVMDGVVSVEVTTKIGSVTISEVYVPVAPSEETTRKVMNSIAGYYDLSAKVDNFNTVLAKDGVDRIDFYNYIVSVIKTKYGYINSAKGLSIEAGDYNLALEFTDFDTVEEYKASVDVKFPSIVNGCEIEYRSKEVRVNLTETKAYSSDDSSFQVLKNMERTLVFVIGYSTYASISEYKSVNAEKLEREKARIQEQLVKEEQHSYTIPSDNSINNFDTLPEMVTVEGVYSTFYVTCTVDRWNDVCYRIETDIETAKSDYDNTCIKISEYITAKVEAAKEEKRRADERKLRKLIDYAESTECKVKEATETTVTTVEVGDQIAYTTNSISFSISSIYDEHEDDYVEYVFAHMTPKFSFDREEIEKLCAYTNRFLNLAKNGWEYYTYIEENDYRDHYSRLVVDGKIITGGIDTDLVIFMVAGDYGKQHCLISEDFYYDCKVVQYDVLPDSDIYDNACEVIEGHLRTLYYAFEGSKLARKVHISGLQSTIDRCTNKCRRNAYNEALELFIQAYDLIENNAKANGFKSLMPNPYQ